MRTREELISRYRHLSRRLADESLTEQEAAAIRRELEGVKAEIEHVTTVPSSTK